MTTTTVALNADSEHDQTDRDFAGVWCNACATDVTARFSPDVIDAWDPAVDDYVDACPECGEKAVHQHAFNV
jgi:hypothetical protein